MELFPVCTACAARATDFNPEPQTLLIVMAPVAGESPPIDCGLSRGILTESGGDDVAHDALVDLCGIDAGALHRLAHGDGAELRRAEIGEAALKFSDGVRQPEMMTTSSKEAMNQAPAKISRFFIIDAAGDGMRRVEQRIASARRRSESELACAIATCASADCAAIRAPEINRARAMRRVAKILLTFASEVLSP